MLFLQIGHWAVLRWRYQEPTYFIIVAVKRKSLFYEKKMREMSDLFSSGCYGDTVMTGIFELRALFNLRQKGKDATGFTGRGLKTWLTGRGNFTMELWQVKCVF